MRILIILLFISFNSLGQSFSEMIKIKDVNSFKRVVIENNYEIVSAERLSEWFGEEEADSMYAELDGRIVYEKDNFDHWGTWYDDNHFGFQFKRKNVFGQVIEDNPYDKIVASIKDNCTFYGIQTTKNGNDFSTYSCSASLYKGVIGFMIKDGKGAIITMDKE